MSSRFRNIQGGIKILIKDLPINERPRERLQEKGPSSLSNEELLSIILKDGTKAHSVKDIALKLLKEVDKIQDLRYMTYEKLITICGIGPSKACSVLAAIELGNRINTDIDTITNMPFTSADKVYDYYRTKIGHNTQETFYCVYLNSRNIIIKDKLLFIGTINYSMVHPREIFKEAYLIGAVNIICIHNHPTGDITPSKDDIELTMTLVNVGKILGVKVIDHLIIGQNKYYSFLENGDI